MQELLQLICACVLSSTFAAASPLPVVRAAELVKRQATETTAPTSTAGSSTTSSASSPGNTDRTSWRGSFSNQTGEPSPMLSIVTIALVVAMILILLLARLYYTLKNYPFSIRAFCVPPGGVEFFGIKIRAATPRPPKGPPPPYRGPPIGARVRRGRHVAGEDVGEGGVRMGERDEDDAWDNEGTEAPKESLPTYAVDYSLPGYNPGAGAPSVAPQEVLPSAQAYEAATRLAPRRSDSQPAPIEMQEIVAERLQRQTTTTSDTTSIASSSATRVEDLAPRIPSPKSPPKEEDKPDEQQIEDVGAGRDLGEMEMSTRTSDPVSVLVRRD